MESNQFVTFGFSGELYQLNDETLNVWAQILNTVENSRLLIGNKHLHVELAKQDIQNKFEKLNINPDRIEFRNFDAVLQGDLAFYNHVDIALNPFPFSNRLSLVDALWMGCPVVALDHQNSVSRLGVECLRAADAMSNICDTIEQYIEKSIKLASNQEHLDKLRKQTSHKTRNSPIIENAVVIEEIYGFFPGDHCAIKIMKK